MRRAIVPFGLFLAALMMWLGAHDPLSDPRLKNAFRKQQENGWTYVHLEGTPTQIGGSAAASAAFASGIVLKLKAAMTASIACHFGIERLGPT